VLSRDLPARPPSLLAPKPTRAVAPTWSTYDVESFYQAPPLVREMAAAPRAPAAVAAPSFYSGPVAVALGRSEPVTTAASDRTTGSTPEQTSPSKEVRSSSPSSGARTPRKQRPRPPALNLVDSNFRDS
jgi:hypothetical protein